MSNMIQRSFTEMCKLQIYLLMITAKFFIGDFGLTKLLDLHDSHVTTTLKGTGSEYLFTSQSFDKVDVFGFGILFDHWTECLIGSPCITGLAHSTHTMLAFIDNKCT